MKVAREKKLHKINLIVFFKLLDFQSKDFSINLGPSMWYLLLRANQIFRVYISHNISIYMSS